MRRILFGFLLIMLLSAISLAVPGQISFQGVLKDSAGNPITGTRTVDFAIYSTSTGGGASWSETQTVTIEAGLYNVKLGSVHPFDLSDFDGNTKYLAVAIGGSEILPRVVIVTVPYALRADRATYADTAGSSGGTQNAVLFNPASKQTTTEANAIWVSTSADGTGTLDIKSAISAESSGTQFNAAISGLASNPSATFASIGVIGASVAASGSNNVGVFGYSLGTGTSGVMGQSAGPSAYGVFGWGNNATSYGVYGRSNSGVGIGGMGATVGGSFEATGNNGIAVYGAENNSDDVDFIYGGYFLAPGKFGAGVKGQGGQFGGEFITLTPGVGTAVIAQGSAKGIQASTTDADGFPGWFSGGQGIMLASMTPVGSGTQEGTIYYNSTSRHFYGFIGDGIGGGEWKQLD